MENIFQKKSSAILGLAVILFFISNYSQAAEISGPISGKVRWTKANSPYEVIGNVVVEKGATLIIEPGVEIKFASNTILQIEGELIAKGVSEDKIAFTSSGEDKWDGIVFTKNSIGSTTRQEGNWNRKYIKGSVFDHCIIEKAEKAIDAKVPLLITNSLIRYNKTGILSPRLTIVNTTISENEHALSSWELEILHSSIIDNAEKGPLELRLLSLGALIYGGKMTKIYDSEISNNTVPNLIELTSTENNVKQSISIEKTIIANNIVNSGVIIYTDVRIDYGRFIVRKSIVANNVEGSIHIPTKSSSFHIPTSSSELSNNIFINNSLSISGYPKIFNNNFFSKEGIILLENFNPYSTGKKIDVKNNYWGTVDAKEIMAKIIDWQDDNSRGIVEYKPFKDKPIEIFSPKEDKKLYEMAEKLLVPANESSIKY